MCIRDSHPAPQPWGDLTRAFQVTSHLNQHCMSNRLHHAGMPPLLGHEAVEEGAGRATVVHTCLHRIGYRESTE
eukprot:8139091-Pyramimonas_sp.AAC.1